MVLGSMMKRRDEEGRPKLPSTTVITTTGNNGSGGAVVATKNHRPTSTTDNNSDEDNRNNNTRDDLRKAMEIFGPRMSQIYGQGEAPMTITMVTRAMHAESDHPRYLESSYALILARFHQIYAHACLGRTIPASHVRRAWDITLRAGDRNPLWFAACATAAWLTTQNRHDLALRFLRWATGIRGGNLLPSFADQLEPFGLPTEPGSSDESIDDLLDELDFL